jgi:hypothetical protein
VIDAGYGRAAMIDVKFGLPGRHQPHAARVPITLIKVVAGRSLAAACRGQAAPSTTGKKRNFPALTSSILYPGLCEPGSCAPPPAASACITTSITPYLGTDTIRTPREA